MEEYSPQRARRARRKEDFIAKNARGARFKICEAAALPSPLPVQRARSFGLHAYPNLRVLRDLRGDEINVVLPDSPHGHLKNQKVQTMAATQVELKSPFCSTEAVKKYSPQRRRVRRDRRIFLIKNSLLCVLRASALWLIRPLARSAVESPSASRECLKAPLFRGEVSSTENQHG